MAFVPTMLQGSFAFCFAMQSKMKDRPVCELFADLPPAGQLYLSSHRHRKIIKKQMHKHLLLYYGAGDEARTRYLHLGKVALYQMSYTRETRDIIAQLLELSITFSKIGP